MLYLAFLECLDEIWYAFMCGFFVTLGMLTAVYLVARIFGYWDEEIYI
jgi:hypothetical protein